MLRIFLSLWLALTPAFAFAGSMTLLGAGKPSVAAAGYQGPGDVYNTSSLYFFSCARAWNATYAAATGNLCDVVLTSTGAAACTIKAATTGFADLTGTYCAGSVNLATACAGGCSVSKMYNQVNAGTCDVVQATLASMPLLLLSSTPTGTLPAVQASGSVGTMQVSSCAAVSQPVAYTGVIIRTSGTTNIGMIGNSGGSNIGFDTSGNAFVTAGTVLQSAAANSSWHSVNALANGNGTSSAINVNGSDTTGAAGTQGIAVNTLRAARVTALTGTVVLAEVGAWNAATGSSDRTAMCQNQASAANGYNTAFGC